MRKIIKVRKFKSMKLVVLFALLITLFAAGTLTAGAKGRKPTSISAKGTKSVTVTAGKELELKVRIPSGTSDNYLRWEIVSGSKYVRFDDDDLRDDEVELKALKAGTAKVRCKITGTKKSVTFTVKVKAKKSTSSKKISIVGKSARNVELGDDFELKVKKYSGLKNKYLKWTIADTSIVGFDDHQKTGREVEFRAKKLGTTTITCKNTKTKQKVTFKITVTPDD